MYLAILSCYYYVLLSSTASFHHTPPSDALHLLPNKLDGEQEDLQFRFTIEPGILDCFYQNVKKDHNLEVSYQVIEMSRRFQWLVGNSPNEMRVSFYAKDPQGKIVYSNNMKSDGDFVTKVETPGVYSLCFDNREMSSSKLINLEVYLYSDEDKDRWFLDENLTFSPEVQYVDTVESIKVCLLRQSSPNGISNRLMDLLCFLEFH